MTLPPELKKALEAEMYKEPYGEMVIEMNDVVRVVASFLETQKKELKKIKGVRACDCSHCPKEACWWLKKTIKKYVKLEDVLAVLGEKRKTKGDDEE